jgi:ferric-dicitrate binding protein FerR (iron transport regulator)
MNYLDNKYDQYKVDDWIVDDDFISYVNGSENSAIAILEANPKHSKNINEAKTLVNGLSYETPFVSDDKLSELFSRVNKTIDAKTESPETKIFSLKRLAWPVAVAAAIALVIFFIPSLQSGQEVYATQIGEMESLTLPDNSSVDLNNSSEITFNEKNWDRNISLKGEAFFKVEKGSKFTVNSAQGKVSVLGTQFNIYDRKGYYEVECLEGRVQVDLIDGSTFILKAGDKLSEFNNGQAAVVKEKVVQRIDWLNKFVQIDSMDLGFVFDEVGRYYEVDFVNDKEIRGKRYEGFFSTNSLDSAIYQILWPLGIDYSIEGNKVIIK